MQQTIGIVEAQQHGSGDLLASLCFLEVSEAADDAVGASVPFYLLHALAVASLVRQVKTLGDHAVAASASGPKPKLRILEGKAGWRQSKKGVPRKPAFGEVFQQRAPLRQRSGCDILLAILQEVEGQVQRGCFRG